MGKSRNRSIKLGLLVAAGLILFSLAIYYLGSRQNLFSSSVVVKSYFKNVNGLVEGNKVQYSGITVGYVTNIEIREDTAILVEMSVEKDISEFIRKDSKVQIESDGLMGSKIVSILPGTASVPSIGENDFLKAQESISLKEVLTEAKSVMEESKELTTNLRQISDKMNSGNGDFAMLLNENQITSKLNRVGEELLAITKATEEIVNKVNRGNGDLGRLINDTTITNEANNLLVGLDSISYKSALIADELLQFSKKLNNRNGIIQRLVSDTVMANNIDTTIAKANRGMDDLVDAAQTIEKSWIFNLFSKNKKNK